MKLYELKIALQDDEFTYIVKEFDTKTTHWFTTISATTSEDNALKVIVHREQIKSITCLEVKERQHLDSVTIRTEAPYRDFHVIDEGHVRVWEDGGVETVRSTVQLKGEKIDNIRLFEEIEMSRESARNLLVSLASAVEAR